jgi:hypothetical protein
VAQRTPTAWTSSSSFSADYTADNAGDGDFRAAAQARFLSGSQSQPWLLQADFGSGNSETLTWYKITAGSASQEPAAWTFQGSNDGSSWTTLDTQSGQTYPDQLTKTYTFSNTTAYRYYRLNVTATTGGTSGFMSVAELELGDDYPFSLIWDRVTPINSGGTYNMGVIFTPSQNGTVTHWSFYRIGTGTYTLRLYDSSGSVITSDTHSSAGANGWIDVALTTPQSVTSGTSYMVAVETPSDFVWLSGTQGSDVTWGDLTIPTSPNFAGVSGFNHRRSAAFGSIPSISLTGRVVVGVRFERSAAPAIPEGTGSGTWTYTGTAAGSTTKAGTGTGTWTFTGAGVGSAPGVGPNEGTGTGTWTFTGTAEGVGASTLDPWESGAHGDALVNLEPAAGVLEVTYPASTPPATIVEVSLQRASHQMPALSGVRAMDYPIETDVVGTPHVWVDGVDVTYFRDIPSRIGGWRQEAPFGWTSTTLTFPQVFHYEERGVGDLEWMVADAPVEIAIVTPLGARLHRFTGHLTSEDPGVGRGRTECVWGVEGALWQADHAHHPVPARLDPTDIGTLIPAELNGTPSRRFSPIAKVATGIPDRQRGSTNQSRWNYVTQLLATATVDGGDQWTIEPTGPRSFALVLKDTTTAHWTVTAGAPGVEMDLTHDHHERIDAVYGRGIGPDGYAWRNAYFPDLLPYDPPDYPYSDPDQNVLEGDTDADTLTGTGISDWQRRMQDLGYKSLPVDGVFGPEDTAAVRWVQTLRGIEVDGYMAGQTWAASWNVGAVGGDLRVVRLPLAVRTEVEAFLYGANGATVGTNPDYDPSIIRHEVDIDFGAGVTKAQGREMARRILERGLDPGIVGTVKLTTCPWEGSRWEMDAGDNVLIKGWRGEDVLCRITALEADPELLTVTLTVDSEFRDAMAVVQILERNRESKADPARRPGNPNRRSRQDQDQVTPFEGESPAGRLPRLPLYEGLWTVWPVPVSEVGLIAKLRVWTEDPVTKFAVALFGTPVTANQVAAKVPDPLAETNPWQAAGDAWLDSVGWIEGWGEEGQAAGYGMLGSESDGDPVTGVLYDDAGVPFVSLKSPWLWVALYSPVSTFIEGRIYPEPTQ